MSTISHIHTLVRGVIAVEKHVLLARCVGASNTFLPGGHVATHESLKDALTREIFEELGLIAQIGIYLGLVEHEWSVGGESQHEVNHIFAALLPDVSSLRPVSSRESHLEFFWAPIANLGDHNLQPSPMIGLLQRDRHCEWGAFFASTVASSASDRRNT